MKRPVSEYLLVYASCGFTLAMVFHSTWGLPDYTANLFLIAAMGCFYVYWTLRQRRATASGDMTDSMAALARWVPTLVAIAVLCAILSLLFEIFHR